MTTAAVEDVQATEIQDERPMHAAVCEECKHTVAFRFTATKMILEFRRRRREKAEGGEGATSSASVPAVCRFQQLHPGIPCPLSHDGLDPDLLASEAHGTQAYEAMRTTDLECCLARLLVVPHVGFTIEHLRALPIEQQSELEAWVQDAVDHPDERERWLGDGLPVALRTAHKAGPLDETSDPPVQVCTSCGEVLFTMEPDDESPLAVGTLVGSGCEGQAKIVGNRYPKKDKAKKARRKADAK